MSSPKRLSNTFTGSMVWKEIEMFLKIESEVYLQDLPVLAEVSPADELYSLSSDHSLAATQCAEVDATTMDFDTFFHNYWLPQKPVVIRNMMNVTNLQLLNILSKYKDVMVGAKLSPDIEFEGVDSLLHWEMAGEQDVPKKVLQQLQSPDMVVVRAVSSYMRKEEEECA